LGFIILKRRLEHKEEEEQEDGVENPHDSKNLRGEFRIIIPIQEQDYKG
jgi:hypothetical protein